MSLFHKPTQAEIVKKQGQDLRRAQREIDRSKRDLEKQEKQLEMEIKKAAKSGQNQVCTALAKQLVQLRKQKARMTTAGSQIGAVSSQAKVMQANNALASAVATSAKTLGQVNRQMDPAAIAATMRNFEQENAKMDMKGEVMDDALASVLDHSDDEAEQDAVITQVLDEIGIDLKGKLADAPVARGRLEPEASTARKVTDDELEAQLARLKAL